MFNPDSAIIGRIRSKNKSLIQSLKVVDITLEGDYVIFRRKDSTTGQWMRIKYKYDSFYQLKHDSNWIEEQL